MSRADAMTAGTSYGRWTTVRLAGCNGRGEVCWICQCECGTVRPVKATALANGTSKSCGCSRGGPVDLRGKRFGKLQVLARAERPMGMSDGAAWWLCRCDCGTITTMRSGSLVDRNRSCGCGPRSRPKDMTGQRFGLLEVVEFAGIREYGNNSGAVWRCRCDCGNVVERTRASLVKTRRQTGGKFTSCGCAVSAANTMHGMSYGREYGRWKTMVSRCHSPGDSGWSHYGGRGIVVCSAWRNFETFHADMGLPPSTEHTLDRIKVNGNYSCGKCEECVANGWPMNVQWATRDAQARNRRTNRLLTHNGVTLCLTDWADRTGLTIDALRGRLGMGWSIERTITTPPLPGTRVTR